MLCSIGCFNIDQMLSEFVFFQIDPALNTAKAHSVPAKIAPADDVMRRSARKRIGLSPLVLDNQQSLSPRPSPKKSRVSYT